MRSKTYVTVEGMVKSQPGTSVSYTMHCQETGDKVVLSVTRNYRDLKNSFGGRGRSKLLDANGKVFDTFEEAQCFAAERGYLQEYFPSKALRDGRKARSEFWKAYHMSNKH